ncbi:hypothetical protein EV121DRAFT_284888 [Schizophyllum commune]
MTQYTQVTVLPGQKDGVLSIGFSACGTFLVATGYAGVCIWDVATQKDVAIPSPPSTLTEKHIYTRSVWLHFEDTGIPILVLGSMRGDMAIWKWRHSTNPRLSVIQLAFGARKNRQKFCQWTFFVVPYHATRDQIRRLFVVDLPPPFCPKTVKFDASSRTIVAFSATGGTMASVAVDPTKSIFAAHTGSSIEINLLKKQKHIKSIDIGAPDIYYPMYMAFGEGGDILVSGTDKGRALLHNVVDGSLVQTLFYPQGGLVQQVAIAKLTGAHRDPGTQESGTSAFERMCWGIMIALLIVYGAIVVPRRSGALASPPSAAIATARPSSQRFHRLTRSSLVDIVDHALDDIECSRMHEFNEDRHYRVQPEELFETPPLRRVLKIRRTR